MDFVHVNVIYSSALLNCRIQQQKMCTTTQITQNIRKDQLIYANTYYKQICWNEKTVRIQTHLSTFIYKTAEFFWTLVDDVTHII